MHNQSEMHKESKRRILFCDLELAQRVELLQAQGGVAYAQAHARLFPQSGATFVPVGSGSAAYAGIDSPITQAFGLGLAGEVTVAEIVAMEEFYFARRAAVNVETCPLAHPSLFELLAMRGYKPSEHSNVLVQALPRADEGSGQSETGEQSRSAVRARLAAPDEEQVWAEVVARGFVESDEMLPMMLELSKTVFHQTDTFCFVAELEGEIIGGAAMNLYNGVGALAGASTLSAYRRRGAQAKLLDYRLRFAAEQGCDLATVTTLPGSGSQRNAERSLFQVAYTRTKWTRPCP